MMNRLSLGFSHISYSMLKGSSSMFAWHARSNEGHSCVSSRFSRASGCVGWSMFICTNKSL